jgi:DNA-binding CsgD family transcriptional regulator
MPSQLSPIFRGRASERDRLGGLLEKVRGGESAALVIRGEAGIGKTALLDQCIRQAADFRVARIAGAESEMELPFAGLHQLCAPMLAAAQRLPDPQRDALSVAFGLISGDAPDRFLVALATLSLLAEAALDRPLLCVVDDAQWLDSASGQVFGFVARRILAESVLMLFAVRDPAPDHHLDGVAALTLPGLDGDDSRALLAAASPGRIDDRVRDRLVDESRGNPLALLELPRGMTSAELAGGFPVPESSDLPGQLEEHFHRRLAALPKASRQLMLVAAADPTGDVALLLRAARTLGIEQEVAAPFDTDQLVEIGTEVRFRHPLVRSAIYSGASSEDRRTAHSALAAAIDPESDPDRRAWHRSLAAAGPDEEVAAELERSAGRARSRGGLAAAAALLGRSVTLTVDPQRRADRALAAAQAQLRAGAFGEALNQLTTATSGPLDELTSARIELLRGQIAFASGDPNEASAQLLSAALRLESFDLLLARDTYLHAWVAAYFANDLGARATLAIVSEAARHAAQPEGTPRSSDHLLDGLAALITEGPAAAAPTLVPAIDAFTSGAAPADELLLFGSHAGMAAITLWDFERFREIAARQLELVRSSGALALLPIVLTANARVAVHLGEFERADLMFSEVQAVLQATGTRFAPYGPMWLAALQGNEDVAAPLIDAAIATAESQREGMGVQTAHWASAVLYNGLGRYGEALAAAQQVIDGTVKLHLYGWALTELIEAAVRCHQPDVATQALAQLTAATSVRRSEWGLGVEARARALLSDGDAADAAYREAITHLSRTGLRPDLARSHLLYGEWLRRQARRVDAREELRIAHDLCSDIGMSAFADRAVNELRATGATVRKRRDDTRDDLTAQEELIARLAVQGRTNTEIGAQLYLSPRTVEWHLRKVFTKLNVTSRRALPDALPTRAGGAVSK